VQPIDGGLSLGRSGEQGAFVLAKDAQPVREISGVIGPGVVGNPEIRAKECGSKLGNQFLGGIAFVAPALAAEFAVETRRLFRLMRRLMREGGVIALGVLERLERRHLHIFVVNRVVGAVAAEADVGGDLEPMDRSAGGPG